MAGAVITDRPLEVYGASQRPLPMHYEYPTGAPPGSEFGAPPYDVGQVSERLRQTLPWVMKLTLLLTYKRISDILMTVGGGEMEEGSPYEVRDC